MIKLFENSTPANSDEDKFSVEIRFSAGAVGEAQLAEFAGFSLEKDQSTAAKVFTIQQNNNSLQRNDNKEL